MLKKMKKIVFSPINNRGSSMVTVIISMFFLATIGATILYMTYTGYLIKATQERGVQNYYDSTELMDLVRAGFQEVASDSISSAYENTLINYGNSTTTFYEELTTNMFGWKTNEVVAQSIAMRDGTNADSTASYVYNTNVLAYFLINAGVDPNDIYIEGVSDPLQRVAPIHLSGNLTAVPDTLTGLLGNAGNIEYDDYSIVFKGISITYTNPDTNLRTNITSDIAIDVPGYFSVSNGDVLFDFLNTSEFAVIATEDLTVSGNGINGSVYASPITLTGNTTTNINGTFITPQTLNVPVQHSVAISANSKLWAQNVTLENNATLTVADGGDLYVENDVALNGSPSTVRINGNFYGFGNSVDNPLLSSSVVINGINSVFDISGADRVMIAGNSFVLPMGSSVASSGVLMGESISVRPNQLAYLVPVSVLPSSVTSNPYIIPDSEAMPSTTGVNMSAPILNGKSLNDYKATVQTMAYTLVGTNSRAVYYFITFSDVDSANAYFRDYFTTNGSQITDYVSLYATLSTFTSNIQTSGNAIQQDASGAYTLPALNPVNEQTAEYMQNTYNKLCKTLSDTDTNEQNPYNFLVDSVSLRNFAYTNSAAGPVYEFKDSSGTTVALVIDNQNGAPFALNSGVYSNVSLIIASGDVSVNSAFSGLIISNGKVTLGSMSSVSSNPSDVALALDATAGDGTKVKDLLTGSGDKAVSGENESTETRDIKDLVAYENWTKS